MKIGQRPALAHRIRQSHEFLDVERFRPPRAVDARRFEQSFAAKALQALPQHLAALAECGFGDAAELLHVGGAGDVARGTRCTTEDVTFGGGVKACGGTSKAILASVRQPARTPSRAIGCRLPGLATMRSATSRWNISVIDE